MALDRRAERGRRPDRPLRGRPVLRQVRLAPEPALDHEDAGLLLRPGQPRGHDPADLLAREARRRLARPRPRRSATPTRCGWRRSTRSTTSSTSPGRSTAPSSPRREPAPLDLRDLALTPGTHTVTAKVERPDDVRARPRDPLRHRAHADAHLDGQGRRQPPGAGRARRRSPAARRTSRAVGRDDVVYVETTHPADGTSRAVTWTLDGTASPNRRRPLRQPGERST